MAARTEKAQGMVVTNKRNKGPVLTWILVDAAFLIIVIALLGSFVYNGRKAAATQGRNELIWQVSEWTQVIDGLKDVAVASTGVFEYAPAELTGPSRDKRIAGYLKGMAEATPFDHVCLFDGLKMVMDETGEFDNVYKVMSFSETGYQEVTIVLMGSESGGKGDAFAVCVPVGEANSTYYFAFIISLDTLGNLFKPFGYTEYYFLSVMSPDGNLLGTFDEVWDSGTVFYEKHNLIKTIMDHSDKDEYYLFKARLAGRLTCSIQAKVGSDERTIAFVPFDNGNYYLAMGLRQPYFDAMCENSVTGVIKTTVRLGVVIFMFSAFVLGTMIFSSVRHKEEGKVLEDKADTDLLTDLNNKLATERKIQEHIDEHPSERGMLFIFDVDNFKKINDTMGHAFGDLMLKTIGRDVRSVFRTSDIIGRIGGDEFVIYVKNLNGDAEILEQARRLTAFFHDFKAGGDYVKYSATASIGVAVFPDDAKNFKALYEAADQALYRSKQRGKARLSFYNEAVYGESIKS